MKKLMTLLLTGILLFSGCSQTAQKEPQELRSLEAMGYTVDASALPPSIAADVQVSEGDVIWYGAAENATYLDLAVYEPYSKEYRTAMILQAVPAGTEKIILDGQVVSVEELAGKKVFENQDVIVFDLCDSSWLEVNQSRLSEFGQTSKATLEQYQPQTYKDKEEQIFWVHGLGAYFYLYDCAPHLRYLWDCVSTSLDTMIVPIKK